MPGISPCMLYLSSFLCSRVCGWFICAEKPPALLPVRWLIRKNRLYQPILKPEGKKKTFSSFSYFAFVYAGIETNFANFLPALMLEKGAEENQRDQRHVFLDGNGMRTFIDKYFWRTHNFRWLSDLQRRSLDCFAFDSRVVSGSSNTAAARIFHRAVGTGIFPSPSLLPRWLESLLQRKSRVSSFRPQVWEERFFHS